MKGNFVKSVAKSLLGLISVLPKKKDESARPKALAEDYKTNKIRKEKAIAKGNTGETIETHEKENTTEEDLNQEMQTVSKSQTGKVKTSAETLKKRRLIPDQKPESMRHKEKGKLPLSSDSGTKWCDAFPKEDSQKKEKRPITLSSLGISARIYDCLLNANITTLGQLQGQSQEYLISLDGLGKAGLDELKEALKRFDYGLVNGEIGSTLSQDEIANTDFKKPIQGNKEKPTDGSAEILKAIPKGKPSSEKDILDEINKAFNYFRQSNEGVATLISRLKEINKRNHKSEHGQSALLYIEKSAINFMELYANRYDSKQIRKIDVAIALIARKSAESFASNPNNSTLLQATASHCNPQEATGFHFLLRSLSGESILEIESTTPKRQSSDSVRQKMGLASRVMLTSREKFEEELKNELLLTSYRQLPDFIEKNGRLPCNEDFSEDPNKMKFYADISKLTLQERLSAINSLGLSGQTEEYNYHYQTIIDRTINPGDRYWLELDHITEFLKRHALALGEPSLMPKQIDLPPEVRGAVTRYGGQAYVASKAGLEYQGQLGGAEGGTFWPLENIEELFAAIRNHKDQSSNWEPNKQEIRQFLETTDIDEFRDKKIESLMAALQREGIDLSDESKDDLWDMELKGTKVKSTLSEAIPKQKRTKSAHNKGKSKFVIDEKRANQLKGLDDSVRDSLSAIFSDDTESKMEDRQNTDNDVDAGDVSTNKADLGYNQLLDLYGLLRDNIIEEEYIKKSILIEYASNKRLMPNFLVDQINEIAIDTSGTLLLEEEDEEKYYISSEVLELIHSRLTPS